MRPETTYNNSGKSSYANFEIGPELNKPYVQVVKQQVKMHQDDLHETCVVCLPCCVLLLDSSCFVAIVRIRSSTLGSSSWLHLLHGLVLLPSGISGKMTVTLDLITIIAMLVASFYRYAALPITCSSSLPNCHVSNESTKKTNG